MHRASADGARVDWAAVRAGVDAAGRALAEAAAVTPERAAALLEQRARALARPTAPPATDGLELITFVLGSERYAVEARYVVGVFPITSLTPLPGAAPPVCAVTAWRGELLAMLDLRVALGVTAGAIGETSRAIALGEARPAFGIVTDWVHELVALPAAAVREPPEGVAARREYLRGVTVDAMLVLDAAAILRLHG